MDILDKVKDKIPPAKLAGLKEWYAWCDSAAERYTKEVKTKLAFELGHIQPELVAGMKAAFVSALREAGRHIVTTNLCDTVKAESGPPPTMARHPRDDEPTGPGPDSPYTPDGVFGDGGDYK